MMANVATTGEKLRRFRRGQAMTQAQLADAAGVNQSTIAMIEGEKRPNPHPATLGKLARALGVRAADLLDDSL